MSGMVGFWNLDGEPVSREHLSHMSARMAHRGPDGDSQWVKGDIGFAFQMMKVTPESADERQPLTSATGVTLVFDGRLDAREELLAKLAPDAKVSLRSSDPEIVLAAYQKLGRDFVKHLTGDIALALWDGAKHRLFLARDIMGGRTLYYCRFGKTFLFATEIKALLAHPLVQTRPNEIALAEYFHSHFDYSDPAKTFFTGITSVLPAHLLTVSPEREVSERFWDFQPGQKLRFHDDRDYMAGYREHFLTAVKRRMRSSYPVASMASGGLDSSSIFCSVLALKAQSPSTFAECFGIAGAPESPDANEVDYQRAMEKTGDVQLLKVPLRDARTLGEARTDVYHSEAPYAQWHDWKQIWEQAHRRGARVLLSGYCGDHLLQFPYFYNDLARSFRWLTLKEHFDAYCRFYDSVPPGDLRRELFSGLKGYALPPALRPIYQWLKRSFRRPEPPMACFSERMAAAGREVERHAQAFSFPSGSAHARALYHFVHSRHINARIAVESLWASQYGLDVAYPFRDRDLVAYLMAIPGEKVFTDGVPRGIHREAMRGILPEEIRLRRTKADFSAIGRQSALADLDAFLQTLPGSRGVELGYLKPHKALKQDLQQLRQRMATDTGAVTAWEAQDVVWFDVWLSVFF